MNNISRTNFAKQYTLRKHVSRKLAFGKFDKAMAQFGMPSATPEADVVEKITVYFALMNGTLLSPHNVSVDTMLANVCTSELNSVFQENQFVILNASGNSLDLSSTFKDAGVGDQDILHIVVLENVFINGYKYAGLLKYERTFTCHCFPRFVGFHPLRNIFLVYHLTLVNESYLNIKIIKKLDIIEVRTANIASTAERFNVLATLSLAVELDENVFSQMSPDGNRLILKVKDCNKYEVYNTESYDPSDWKFIETLDVTGYVSNIYDTSFVVFPDNKHIGVVDRCSKTIETSRFFVFPYGESASSSTSTSSRIVFKTFMLKNLNVEDALSVNLTQDATAVQFTKVKQLNGEEESTIQFILVEDLTNGSDHLSDNTIDCDVHNMSSLTRQNVYSSSSSMQIVHNEVEENENQTVGVVNVNSEDKTPIFLSDIEPDIHNHKIRAVQINDKLSRATISTFSSQNHLTPFHEGHVETTIFNIAAGSQSVIYRDNPGVSNVYIHPTLSFTISTLYPNQFKLAVLAENNDDVIENENEDVKIRNSVNTDLTFDQKDVLKSILLDGPVLQIRKKHFFYRSKDNSTVSAPATSEDKIFEYTLRKCIP